MSEDRLYPDEPAGPFPEPPRTFTDRDGREIEIRAAGEDDLEAIVEMYVDFDPADRAQGLPPTGEARIRQWLAIITDESLNVCAWHGDRVAGHATLVPENGGKARDDGDRPASRATEYELAIFVLQDYQGAGVGSELLPTLLGYGAAHGAEKVWLTVERWNRAAVALYEKVGFEIASSESFELEMALRLA